MDTDAKPAPTCTPVTADPNAVCDECGASGAFVFTDVKLCLGCYTQRGSCCPEFGREEPES